MTPSLLDLPWVELAVAASLSGAVWVSCVRTPVRAFTAGLIFSGATLACALLAWLAFVHAAAPRWRVLPALFGTHLFALDTLSAPLFVLVALVHFLTALATGRTKMRRFSMTWSLGSEAIRLATFACLQPWVLIGLLTVCTVPPYLELQQRGQGTRIYILHMGLFVALLVVGWALLDPDSAWHTDAPWAALPLLTAILVRCGTVPAHCWLTDWFEHASFGNALLFVTPLTGVYAAVRLVLPVAPDWVLQVIGLFSIVTAVYAAGMAVVQQDTRRFFAYLFLSHAALVLVGLELHTVVSLTGALALWVSVTLALAGFGLTLRALEARFGRLSLRTYSGLYAQSPMLAICFLLTGLGSVGFPGTLGFVAAELLVDGAVTLSPMLGLPVIAAAALNGIAVVRAYFALFTGARSTSSVSLALGVRERLAVLTLAVLILGGGLYPQPGVASRYEAACVILRERAARTGEPAEELAGADHDRDAAAAPTISQISGEARHD